MQTTNHNAPAVIELGTVTEDTRGDRGVYWEGFALQPHAGLSDE